MNVILEVYDREKHYDMVVQWWCDHGWTAVPHFFLPKLGIVAYTQQGEPIAAWWMYLDNSCPVAIAEWLVSNPKIGSRVLIGAIWAIWEIFEQRAREMGYQVVITTSRVHGLISVLEKIGFRVTDSGMTHLVKKL